MDWWLASFFLGAIFSLFLPIVPDIFVLFSLLLSSLLLFYYPLLINKPLKPFRLSSGLLFGASWMLFNAFDFHQSWQENSIEPVNLASKSQWIQGEVLSLLSPISVNDLPVKTIKSNNRQLRFNLRVRALNNKKLRKPIKIRLSWKNTNVNLQQGQVVNLQVKIKPAHGLANVGGFSYQTWLNSKRIIATGYVVKNKQNQIVNKDITYRQRLYSQYQENLSDHSMSPLLLALGFGSRTELSPDIWDILQKTGTGHLIAISGLHIGLVATSCFYFTMLMVRVLPFHLFSGLNRLQTRNCRFFAIGISMIAALSYGYLAGFSLPTVRALVMLCFFWSAKLLSIKLSLIRWFLLTLFVITLISPFSLFTASFWLSVYAVMIIFITLWWYKNKLVTNNRFCLFLKTLILIQLSLTCMLLPVSAVFFQQISIVAILANIIAVPWMSFITIPLCLLSVAVMPISESFSQVLTSICVNSLEYLWVYLIFLSKQSWAISTLSSFHVWMIVLFIICGGLFCLKSLFQQAYLSFAPRVIKRSNFYIFFLACFIASPLLILTHNNPTDKNERIWQLVVFDVGQGLSILVKKENKAILYDTGASYESGFNMIDAVVLPYLQSEGIDSLDKVYISHGDNDHAGGLDTLKAKIHIKELIYNSQNDVSTQQCIQGRITLWQGLRLESLWPIEAVAKENDDSCVLLISDEKHKVLLTGDISKKVEKQLLKQYPNINSTILIVPHHGSKTSSSEAFITQIKPKLAIVSAGFLNRWKMPVAGVVKRYQKEKVKLVNTANSGQIILNFSKNGLEENTYRDNLWPFWFAKPL